MTDSSSEQKAQHIRDELQYSELFLALVVQIVQSALTALGQLKLQDGSNRSADLELGQFYIDTLEMLEHKTRGNLHPAELEFVKQQLTILRMCFVQAAESGGSSAASTETAPASSPEQQKTTEKQPPETEEQRKRFVKKYGAEGSAASQGGLPPNPKS